MDRPQLNELKNERRVNSEKALKALRAVEPLIADLPLNDAVKSLRSNDLKSLREFRYAALFCYGISKYYGFPIDFVFKEASDYDFVASWQSDDQQHFAPVQMKEVVPERLNRTAALQKTIDKLTKYPSSHDLTVAILINRNRELKLEKITLPNINIAALWLFWAVSPDQSLWCLYGNMLEKPEHTYFEYPI